MILVDDLLVRPFVGFLGVLNDMAIREAYDVEAIRNEIKENRLLYEIGDRSEAEYRQRQESLEERFDEVTFQYSGPWAPYSFVDIEIGVAQ